MLGIHRSLFCAPAGWRTAEAGDREPAGRRPTADRAGDNRSRRDRHVYCRLYQSGRQGREEDCRTARLATRRKYRTSEGDRLTDEVQKAGYLRTVQDWIISPQLKAVPGVAGVDLLGGYAQSTEEDKTELP